MNKLYDIAEPSTEPKKGLVVGIDLGTTNSLIAMVTEEDGADKAKLFIDPSSGKAVVPSIVSYDSGGECYVGEAAASIANPIYSVKRLMGKSEHDLNSISNSFNKLITSEKLLSFDTVAGSKTPEEISAAILNHLKKIAEEELGQAVTHAVITVPAYFDDAARNATKNAAKIADIEVMRLINEPTAACFAYGLERYEQGVFAVYDLGGGTFDVSILKRQLGVFRVLATGGDSNLGGDDFDHLISNYLLAKHGIVIDFKQARQLKEQLSSKESVSIVVEGKKIELTQQELFSIIKPLVDKTLKVFKKVVRDAELDFNQLDEIILVGGATKMPFIQNEVAKLTGKKPVIDQDPETIVAKGAALQAATLTGKAGELLLDVLPLSLGIELMGEVVEVIIPRNSLLPAEVTKVFTTYADGQTAFKIHVLQGEGGRVNACRSLARFELTGLKLLPAGEARLNVTFKVDVDGILTVSAYDPITTSAKEVMVNATYGLTSKDIIEIINRT
jgi:molecular chaperone HscA